MSESEAKTEEICWCQVFNQEALCLSRAFFIGFCSLPLPGFVFVCMLPFLTLMLITVAGWFAPSSVPKHDEKANSWPQLTAEEEKTMLARLQPLAAEVSTCVCVSVFLQRNNKCYVINF